MGNIVDFVKNRIAELDVELSALLARRDELMNLLAADLSEADPDPRDTAKSISRAPRRFVRGEVIEYLKRQAEPRTPSEIAAALDVLELSVDKALDWARRHALVEVDGRGAWLGAWLSGMSRQRGTTASEAEPAPVVDTAKGAEAGSQVEDVPPEQLDAFRDLLLRNGPRTFAQIEMGGVATATLDVAMARELVVERRAGKWTVYEWVGDAPIRTEEPASEAAE